MPRREQGKKKKQPKIFPPSFSVYNVEGDGAHKQGWPVRLDEELKSFSRIENIFDFHRKFQV